MLPFEIVDPSLKLTAPSLDVKLAPLLYRLGPD